MPFDILPRMTGLADYARDDLAQFFASAGHAPSPEQWAAIGDLLQHLERAARGELAEALYVSALPAGTGKSQSIAAFARGLMASAEHDATGVLILVNRIAEAEDMAKMLATDPGKLCIFTSDPKVNALGAHETAGEAQVCIATQAALKATLRQLDGKPFAAATRFHYRSARRAVVCWDESFAFNRPVTLDADTVGGLAKAMRRQSDEATATLKRWASELDDHAGGLCAVPDFEALGVDFRRLEDDASDDEQVAQAKALAVVSGNKGFVTRQGRARTLVTHYPEIPASLMPVIVTDASAKVNPSYRQMASVVPLRWLGKATKTYRNMTIRLVPTAASRSVYRDPKTFRGRDLIDLAVRYVEGTPADAEVLIVGYKGRFVMRGVDQTTIREAIAARLKLADRMVDPARPEDGGRVHYLPYGQHTATNAFKHVRHVLLLGLNFLPKAAGYAASGAALDLNLIDQHPTNDQIREMQSGMLMDATLQAVLRGHARVSVGGDCGEMEAVICQTRQTGISPDDYRRMFPGATVIDDTVLIPPKPLKGRLAELDAIIVRRLAAGETEVTNESLWDELGMAKPNFLALVKRPEWRARVAQLGLNPQKLAGRRMGLRSVAA